MNNLSKRVTFVIVAILLAAGSAFAICPNGSEGGQPISPVGPNQPVGTPVTYTWSTPTAANWLGFEVWLKTDGDPTLVQQCSAGPGDSSCVGGPLAAGQYEWIVRTNYAACGLGYTTSSIAAFHAGACPSSPVLNSPANNQGEVPLVPTFTWSDVGADEYDIYLGKTGTGVCIHQTGPVATTFAPSFNPPPLEEGQSYQWRVVAKKNGCNETSSCFTFTTESSGPACSEERATLLSPEPLARFRPGAVVNFSWGAVPGAIGYEVIVVTNNGVVRNIGSGDTSATDTFPQGTYGWTVKTIFPGPCGPTFSEGAAFIVEADTPSCPNAPALISPANGATKIASPVEFRWTGVNNAASYRLYLAFGNGDFAFVGETTDTSLTRIVPPGTVRWVVESRNGDCPGVRSNVAVFTAVTKECPGGSITLGTPANNASVASPVTFTWSAVSGTDAYRLWIATGDGSPALAARTSATTATINLPSGTAKWFVEAVVGDDCPPIVSERRTLTVQQAANCDQHTPPVLIAPSGAVGSAVTFRWNAVANARGYRLWLSTNGQPFEDIAVVQTTSLARAFEPGRYSWYVQAIFDGCPPVASANLEFTVEGNANACSEEKPSILTPANNANATSPVTFSWTAVAKAISYRVFAALNDGEPQLIGATELTTLTRVLPPGRITWLVQAVFERCPSTESARSTFTVPRGTNCPTTPAALVSPGNNVSDHAPDVTFTWNAVAGAVRYALLVRRNSGPETNLGETTETTLARKLPAGLYEWTVVTYFADCDPLRAEPFVFSVAEPENCDIRRPLLLTPPNGARVTSPVEFAWTAVPRATSYKLWIEVDGLTPALLTTTTETHHRAEIPAGRVRWWVEVTSANCPAVLSSDSELLMVAAIACGVPEEPRAFVIGQAVSGSTYTVRWTPVPNADLYELQESSTFDFGNARSEVLSGNLAPFSHEATGQPVIFYYRIRAISSCNDERGPYSDVVKISILPKNSTRGVTAELGTEGDVVQTIQLPGVNPPVTFAAFVDKPGFTVTPSTGTLGPDGVTLTITASRERLLLGTNTATVRISYGSSKGPISTDDSPATVPVSISLVTPVTPSGKNTPPPDALIIPAVAHAAGANNSQFESDVRITNLASQIRRYQLNFTPSNSDGRTIGSTTTIEIEPGNTVALDDILASVFGVTAGAGALEIRPLNTTVSTTTELSTVASSRTYNVTPTGTFGQWIPAIPYVQFVGRSTTGAQALLSLQQIAQSSDYRTNFGFVEGSGTEANLLIRIFNALGQQLTQVSQTVPAFGHVQLPVLAANGVTLNDGRVEVEVVSAGGRVTAYASLVDNKTNDPLLVTPVVAGASLATRYALPGMAYINNGLANWQSDVRLYNSNTTPTTATLTYYPQQNPTAAIVRELTLAGGEMKAFDNILNTFYGIADPVAGGQIVVSTPGDTSIIATARTYNQTSNGTYGQFIPGVTPAQSVGRTDRALQVLQLEQSARFRTNIGVAETSGNAATVDVSVVVPGSRVTPTVTLNLKANEFYQFSLASFGLGDGVYNARVTVKVTSGNGRVTAYGSVIDMTTQDPTYVPAQ